LHAISGRPSAEERVETGVVERGAAAFHGQAVLGRAFLSKEIESEVAQDHDGVGASSVRLREACSWKTTSRTQ
jgi:hypothetical protein